MKNRLMFAVFAVVAILFVATATVNAQTNGGDDVVSTPSTSTGTGSSEGSVSNGGDDSVSSPTTAPTTSTTGSEGSVSNGDDDVAVSTPTTPSTPTSNSGSSRSGRGSSRNSTTTPSVLGASTFTCPLITTSMKLGWKNDGVEVAKLQAFLKNVEKLDVDVTGTFDQKTEDAVKAFQSKNLEKTMGPWGATKPSGFVYITTGKVINQIACASPLTLSTDELAIIEAYKNRSVDVEVIGSDTTTGSSTATSSDEIGSNDSNVAGAGDASILSKFWNFLKNLFK